MGQARLLDELLSEREWGPSAQQTIGIWAETPF